MRVLLTGASGFIGSHVARSLLGAGDQVLALIPPGAPLWRLEGVLDQLAVLEGDLAAVPSLAPRLRQWGPDVCLHLAWYVEPGKYLDAPENLSVLADSLALLRWLPEMGCRQIVAAGSCMEYDLQLGYVREESATRPTTLYAASKLSLGLVGEQWAARTGIRFAWGRIFFLYGPYEHEQRLVPAAVRSLLKGVPFASTAGEQVRDYLHVEDVAAAFRLLAAAQASGVFNIASQTPVTVRQLLETIADVIGRPELLQLGALPYRSWDPLFVCGDNQRLRELGWRPRYSLRSGLEEVVSWWHSRGGQ